MNMTDSKNSHQPEDADGSMAKPYLLDFKSGCVPTDSCVSGGSITWRDIPSFLVSE